MVGSGDFNRSIRNLLFEAINTPSYVGFIGG